MACQYALSLSLFWKVGVWIKWNNKSKTLAQCLAYSTWSVMTNNIIINNLFYDNRLVIGILTLFRCCCCISRSVVSDSFWPHVPWPTRLPCPWNSPSKNPGMGCHSLLQGIFPTQGLNPGPLHCRKTLYHLSHSGPPNWVRERLNSRWCRKEGSLVIHWRSDREVWAYFPRQLEAIWGLSGESIWFNSWIERLS